MNNIFGFAWKVFFISWIVFLFLDVLRPGFVSNVFSVHILLFVALVCAGITLGVCRQISEESFSGSFIMSAIVGCFLSLLVWRAGGPFGDVRIFLAIVAFVLPWILLRSLEESDV